MTESVGRISEEAALEAYLGKHIPISRAMGIRVSVARDDQVVLTAPLQENINHQQTVFGGSAAAVAILAGWSLLHVRLPGIRNESRIVIQRTNVEYLEPIEEDFDAIADPPQAAEWERFSRSLERRGRGRIEVDVELKAGALTVGRCRGTYVVLPIENGEE